MTLSTKARTLLMRSYETRRAIATFDVKVQQELILSDLMEYSQEPLMIITEAGVAFCDWEKKADG